METDTEIGQGLEQSKGMVPYGETGVTRTGRPTLPMALDRGALALALGAAVLGVLAAGGVALARALQHDAVSPSPAPLESDHVTPSRFTTEALGPAYAYSYTYERISIMVREGE